MTDRWSTLISWRNAAFSTASGCGPLRRGRLRGSVEQGSPSGKRRCRCSSTQATGPHRHAVSPRGSLLLMDANPARLNDPEFTTDRLDRKHCEEVAKPIEKRGERRTRRQLDDHDSMRGQRREPHDVPEVAVQRDEATQRRKTSSSAAPPRSCATTVQTFVSSFSQELLALNTDVLVELEPHPACFSVGTGMIRSRDATAPYAIAARMSSGASSG